MASSACCVAFLGEVDVAQDPARHGEEPIGDLGGEDGVCLLVTVLGSDHEIGIHALPPDDIAPVRRRLSGMGLPVRSFCQFS